MKSIYIINSTSRGANYGVGTYVKQLTEALCDPAFKINVINLYTSDIEVSEVKEEAGIRYFKIASPRSDTTNPVKSLERYYTNVYYYMLPYLIQDEGNELIFHFNFMQAKEFALLLKERFNCKIILTVHYMEWSFGLLGDKEHLRNVLQVPKDEKEKQVKKSFENEKLFIDECADRVIAIARHSYDTLLSVYQIPKEKIVIIPNGLTDQYSPLSLKEKRKLREQYYFTDTEKIIIFAGRLDEVKGVDYLLDAFKKLLQEDRDIRLIIAGDGDYNHYFKRTSPCFSKIIFTGFISKEELYNLYQIATVGVVPSLHEEFGYVAVEMMMSGLPVIVNQTTGLAEIAENEVCGLYTSLQPGKDKWESSVSSLVSQLQRLLNDGLLRERLSTEGRSKFLSHYQLDVFKKRMLEYYRHL